MVKGYEILYIMLTTLSEERRNEINDKLKSIIESNGGEITLFEDMGNRDIATEFKKQTKGFYIRMQFTAGPKALVELSNEIKITEDIIRHLNVTMDSIRTNVTENTVLTDSKGR